MSTTYIAIPEKDYLEIIKKLDNLTNLVLGENKNTQINPKLGDWISEEEAMKLLKKKKTSLYYLRISEKLNFTKVGKTIFYSYSSILNLLTESQNNKL